MDSKEIVYRVVFDSKDNIRGGKIVHDKMKAVFLDKRYGSNLKSGIALVDRSSYIDKGNCIFAKMQNVVSVIPESYGTIDFFMGVGVPTKIYKSSYGDCIFLKEVYSKRTYIKAFNKHGDELIKISKLNDHKDNSKEAGMVYRQIAEVLVEWTDITDEVYKDIIASIQDKKSDIKLDDVGLLYVVKAMNRVNVRLLHNGVITTDGKYETLVVWSQDGLLYAVWLGMKCDLGGIDIKDDISSSMESKYYIDAYVVSGLSESHPNVGVKGQESVREYEINKDIKLWFTKIDDSFIRSLSSTEREELTDKVIGHNNDVLDRMKGMVMNSIKSGASKKCNWRSVVYKDRK